MIMRRIILLLAIALICAGLYAQKTPKKVEKARQSVASVLTYRDGKLLGSGTAFFVGDNNELLSAYSLFVGADSAVAIDAGGKVHQIERIVGFNEMFNCLKARVAYSKKIKTLAVSVTPVVDDEILYMLSYGVKNSGAIEALKVQSIDSVYSSPYYTLERTGKSDFVSFPLLNADGELVAIMQPVSMRDTVGCYAVGANIARSIVSQPVNYGRGYYPLMGIRTALPFGKEAALSCLYMQSMIGDSISYGETLEDYLSTYPDSFEGYVSKAEFTAVYQRDITTALKAWEKALSLTDKDAEVYFNKAKVINSIVQSGDSVSDKLLSFDSALSEIDKAIELDNQPIYVNYKADMLYSRGSYLAASDCYESLASTPLRSPEIFAKASQCHVALNDYDRSIELLDSAVNYFNEMQRRDMAPYLLTRAVVKMSAKKYREAVFDYNAYEEIMSPSLTATFYYMREQAELEGKMYQQALNDIENAIYLAPKNAMYYVEKGILCYRVKLFDEGIRALESAKALVPDSPDIYYLLGLIYVQTENPVEAKACLENAVLLGHPNAAEAMENLK